MMCRRSLISFGRIFDALGHLVHMTRNMKRARNGHSDRLNDSWYACMLHSYNAKGGPKPLASESGLWKEGAWSSWSGNFVKTHDWGLLSDFDVPTRRQSVTWMFEPRSRMLSGKPLHKGRFHRKKRRWEYLFDRNDCSRSQWISSALSVTLDHFEGR